MYCAGRGFQVLVATALTVVGAVGGVGGCREGRCRDGQWYCDQGAGNHRCDEQTGKRA